MNLTSSRSHSKLHFFHYKKSYMVYFQNTENSREKYKIHYFSIRYQINSRSDKMKNITFLNEQKSIFGIK